MADEPIGRFDHIGIAVHSIEKARGFFEGVLAQLVTQITQLPDELLCDELLLFILKEDDGAVLLSDVRSLPADLRGVVTRRLQGVG